MVRIVKSAGFFDGSQYIEGFCLSSDTPPTDGIATGSKMTEVDTGVVYLFDEVSGEWINPSAPANIDTPTPGASV